ncbi:MAG TPA: hypothetical protein VFQ60_04170 [Patescibacteria group bacterium]|nr:hypothetical protein [Patescibacteria group bacterium]
MERVPESKPLSRSEQISALLEKLTGHEVFARLRGKLGSSSTDLLKDMIAASESPTAFCHAWDAFSADVRVIGDLLAKLERDGQSEAAGELLQALRSPAFLMEGEEVPVHLTTPVTIVMFDPERTLAMIKWIRSGRPSDLGSPFGWPGSTEPEPARLRVVEELFQKFPSLEKALYERLRHHGYPGRELVQAHLQDVVKPFDSALARLKKDGRRLELAWRTYNPSLEIGHTFGTTIWGMVVLAPQAEVLSCFDRASQSRIGTWACRLPAAMIDEFDPFFHLTNKDLCLSVGFHPEFVHESMQKRFQSMASAGCQYGFGAAILSPWNKGNYLKDLDIPGEGDSTIQLGNRGEFSFMLSSYARL